MCHHQDNLDNRHNHKNNRTSKHATLPSKTANCENLYMYNDNIKQHLLQKIKTCTCSSCWWISKNPSIHRKKKKTTMKTTFDHKNCVKISLPGCMRSNLWSMREKTSAMASVLGIFRSKNPAMPQITKSRLLPWMSEANDKSSKKKMWFVVCGCTSSFKELRKCYNTLLFVVHQIFHELWFVHVYN